MADDWFAQNAPNADWFAQNAPPSAFSRFASAALEGADSIIDAGKMMTGDASAAMRTGQRVAGLADIPKRMSDELSQAGQAMTKADLPGTAYHLAGAVPIVGPAAQQVSDDFKKGDYATGFGHAVNLLAPFMGPEGLAALEKAAPGAAKALTAIKEGAKAAAPDVAAGGAKAAVGAAVAEALPSGPIRHVAAGALAYPGVRQVARGIDKGFRAGREVFNPPAPPPVRPAGLADEFGLPAPNIPDEVIGTPAAPEPVAAQAAPAPVEAKPQTVAELSDALNGELAKDAPPTPPAKAPRDYAAERRGVKVDAFVEHLKDKGVTADLVKQGIPLDKWWDDVTAQVNSGGSRFGTPSLKSRQQIVDKLRASEAEAKPSIPPVQPYPPPGGFFHPEAIQKLIDLQERGLARPNATPTIELAPPPAAKPALPKQPSQMTAGEINKALDKINGLSSKLTDELIAAGHGNTPASELMTMSGSLPDQYRALRQANAALRGEVERRYGPGAPRRLPKGFGPIQ